MFRVRIYSELHHPDTFSRGFLGFCIRALNWIRWKLETFIQKQALKYLTEGSAPVDRESVLDIFKSDVRMEAVEKELSSPKRKKSFTTLEGATRVSKYQELRNPTAFSKGLGDDPVTPMRPTSVLNMIATNISPPRSSRYNRDRFQVRNPEGDFLPLLPEQAEEVFDGADGQ